MLKKRAKGENVAEATSPTKTPELDLEAGDDSPNVSPSADTRN